MNTKKEIKVQVQAQALGKLIQNKRKEKGLSCHDLAKRCGLARATLSAFENGYHTNMGIHYLLRISQELDYNLILPTIPKQIGNSSVVRVKTYKEKMINLMLFRREELLRKLTSSNLEHFEYEKKLNKMYIDVFAVDKVQQLPVYVEVQTGKMNKIHFDKFVQLHDSIEEGLIVWIAEDNTPKYKKKLEKKMLHSDKPIEIIVAQFNSEFLMEVETLSTMDQQASYNRMMKPNAVLPELTVLYTFTNIARGYIGNYNLAATSPLRSVEKVNNDFLNKLRTQFPYFTNFVRSKECLRNRQIQIGSGKARIELVLVPSYTITEEATIKLRSTRPNNQAIQLTLGLLKEKLREINFSSRTSEHATSFEIHYGSLLERNVLEEHMISDIEKIIAVLCDFE